MSDLSGPQGKYLGFCLTVLALAAALAIGFGKSASAQDAAFGRDVWLKQANCSDCHG